MYSQGADTCQPPVSQGYPCVLCFRQCPPREGLASCRPVLMAPRGNVTSFTGAESQEGTLVSCASFGGGTPCPDSARPGSTGHKGTLGGQRVDLYPRPDCIGGGLPLGLHSMCHNLWFWADMRTTLCEKIFAPALENPGSRGGGPGHSWTRRFFRTGG